MNVDAGFLFYPNVPYGLGVAGGKLMAKMAAIRADGAVRNKLDRQMQSCSR